MTAASIPSEVLWSNIRTRLRTAAPEAFTSDGNPLNQIAGHWLEGRDRLTCTSPVDGSKLGELHALSRAQGEEAVVNAAVEGQAWAHVPVDERRERVLQCLADVRAQRDLLIVGSPGTELEFAL